MLLAGAMMLSLAACAQDKDGAGGATSTAGDGKVFAEPTEVSLMLGQSNELFQEDWKVWEYIQEATGATLKFNLLMTDVSSKMAVAFASPETVPDLVCYDYKPGVDNYAGQGALVAIEDVEEYMPNYKAFWENVPEEERERALNMRRSADGKTYWPARRGNEEVYGLNGWFYRKDIFDKHGLTPPKDFDELYETAKKLKELYPETYPLGIEDIFDKFGMICGPQWKQYFEYDVYYDFNTDTWCYGGIEDTMLEIVTTLKKFFDEELLVPTFVSMKPREFNELATTGKVLMFPHAKDRFAMYVNTMENGESEFDLAPMLPPVANKETGLPQLIDYRADMIGLAIGNSKDEKRITNAAKLLDWFYTDEAIELMSWGKEGETYEVKDGEKQFILGAEDTIGSKYGFQTYATGQVYDPEATKLAVLNTISEEDLDIIQQSVGSDGYNPGKWIGFTDEELNVRQDKGTTIKNYVKEMISKFLIGDEPLSNWDNYVKTVKEMGVEELLAVYEAAYNRVK